MPRDPRTFPPLPAWARLIFVAISLVLIGMGGALVWIGVQLIGLGGTWYYALAGLGLVLSGLLLLFNRLWQGIALQAGVVLATLVWALAEIAGKGFLPAWGADLAARVGVPGGLALLTAVLAVLAVPRALAPRGFRAATLVLTGVAVLGGVVVVAGLWERPETPSGLARPATGAAGIGEAAEWAAFGGTPHGQRWTPAEQIGPDNVGRLREVWRMQSGDLSPNDRVFFSSQNTPLKVGDQLYLCTPSNRVFALDPGSGEIRWRFDPEVPVRSMESLFSVACRAVAYHALPAGAGPCAERVFVATVDSRLIALDARDGAVCEGFGDAGEVDLAEGMGLQELGFASSTSGPALVGDALIVGQQVSDNQRRDAPSGVVRAYDAETGALRWAWDALRQGRAAEPLAPGEIYSRGTPNVWNVISGDPVAGIVYVGTGNSGNDHFGGTRTEAEDRFTSAVVAIDLATGETLWDFATVIHDLWDYDIGAQPVVGEVLLDGALRRAVIQGTKTGSIFVFDGATGEPLRPIEMRPAPRGALPGDWVSETQPQSVHYPIFTGIPGPEPEVLDPRHAFGITPVDAAMCRLQFHRMRYEGMFTPPTDSEAGMLLFPGTIGGMNWGGLGLDAPRGILVTNHSRLPNVVRMFPRDAVDDLPVGDGGARPDQQIAPQAGSPWGVDRPIWLSPLQVPCIAPPWGFVSAVDLDTGALLWTRLLGTGFDSGPMGLPTFLKVPLGTANIGGPLVTATGLTFIAAAQDNWLRAYETATGRLMWQGRLPAGGQASPMSYVHEGRQYVVIAATGHQRLQTREGDYLVAFALED
ncbi:MAG: pyrroloquinoline quinone-dependent dehydrogenase [Gemmobacter sp.]